MKIAMVDDEKEYFAIMNQFFHEFACKNHCQLKVATFTDGESFLNSFAAGAYDLVFMDIYIGNSNGVDIARQMLAIDSNCLLVFLTSSSEFMPDAFSCHAFDYITKPISGEHVLQVLQDAKARLLPEQNYVEVANGRRKVPVMLRDVKSVISDLHYLKITLADGTVLRSRMTISEFLTLVSNDPRFVLVNKGILLNADYIVGFEDNCCVVKGDERFPLRVRDRHQIEQTIQDYNFHSMRNRQKKG